MTKGHAMTRRDPSETEGDTNASADNNTRKSTPSARVDKWDWQRAIRDSELSPRTRFVCLLIGTYMDKHGEAWPSIATIAEAAGHKTKKPVYAANREAVQAGYLRKASGGGRGDGGKHKSNCYYAVVPNGVHTETVEGGEAVSVEPPPTVSSRTSNGVPMETRTDQEQTSEQTSVADEPSDQDLQAFVLGRRYQQHEPDHARMLAAAEVANDRDRVLTEWREQGMEPHDIVLGRVVTNLPPDKRRLIHEASPGDRKAFRQAVAGSPKTAHENAAHLNAQQWDWADRPLRAFASEINKQKAAA